MSFAQTVLLWLGILVLLAAVGAACAPTWRIRFTILILVPSIGTGLLLLVGLWAVGHKGP